MGWAAAPVFLAGIATATGSWRTACLAAAVLAACVLALLLWQRAAIDDRQGSWAHQAQGAAAVALHARTAEQAYSGKADWSAIARLKEAVREVPVLGNGDIWVAADALRMVDETGCDGVVVGRGCLGRPWLFGDLAAAFAGRPTDSAPPMAVVVDTLRDHARRLAEWHGDHVGVKDIRKHVGWYLQGYPVGPAIRKRLVQADTLEQFEAILDEIQRAPDLLLAIKKNGFWMNARGITGRRSAQTLSRRKTRGLGSSPSLATSGGKTISQTLVLLFIKVKEEEK